MKTIKAITFAAALLLGAVVMTPSITALALSPAEQMQVGVNQIGADDANSFGSTVKTGIGVFLFLIGAVAVVMIIYGGFKYITSGGESSAITSAKNTILYAVVGLVVALLAFGIANFVVGVFKDDGTSVNQTTQSPPACMANTKC